MVYSFARVSVVVGMRVEDYYQQGKRWWLRLQEKGGKHHAVPVHHKAETSLDAYLDGAGIAAEKDAPLWRSMPRAGGLSARRAILAWAKSTATTSMPADSINRSSNRTPSARGATQGQSRLRGRRPPMSGAQPPPRSPW